MNSKIEWDFVVIGSGFGGSVSSLRLTEKGYRVLTLEKGRRFTPETYAKTNWNLKRFLWLPRVGFRGLLKLTYLRHVTALSGVGVGGGSLVYANTLPIPKDHAFQSGSWAQLADWKSELGPHYQTALKMLGATQTPFLTYPDEILREVGREIGRGDHFESTNVAVYFGEPGVTKPDPFFGGEGPERAGCTQCGGCMVGCRYNAKNTLDKNYLYLAEKRGLTIAPNTEVKWIRPLPGGGYEIEARQGSHAIPWFNKKKLFRTQNIVFSGGCLGTVPLLLKLKQSPDGLPNLSARLGDFVRTNSEVLVGAVTEDRDRDLSKGIAIGSILHTDEHSHLEPVRYPAGSGFFRIQALPMAPGDTIWERFGNAIKRTLQYPLRSIKAFWVPDWAKYTMILLYMRSIDGYLRLRRGRSIYTAFTSGTVSVPGEGPPAKASIPEATDLAERVSRKLNAYPQSILTETLFGIPTTAHILGGCTMGDSPENGVIDHQHRAFGYDGIWIIDGSTVSANLGVNPSLTITALAERAMSLIPPKKS